MYRYAFRRLGDQESAQNIASDSFYRLLVAFRKGKGPQNGILPWLYRTTHNLVIDLYRKSSQQTLPLEEALFKDETPLPEETIMVSQEQEQMRKALQKLTPDQQEVISLKFLEGLKNEEVAEIMNISVGAVKSMQHRALASLARTMQGGAAARPEEERR